MKEIIFKILKDKGVDAFMHYMRRNESEDEQFWMDLAQEIEDEIKNHYAYTLLAIVNSD